MVSSNVKSEIEEMLGHVPGFIEEMPEQVGDHFWGSFRDLLLSDETALDPKVKELIGLGVSAATKCPYCTHFHTEAAKLHGATEAELDEATAVAMMTAAASTSLHGHQTEMQRFKKETAQIVDHIKQQG